LQEVTAMRPELPPMAMYSGFGGVMEIVAIRGDFYG
jgi:hypothetical protein